jgi:multidrug efflux system outer membrane protein
MRRVTSVALVMALPIALAGCSLEPKYVAPVPAIPAGWPVHDPALLASERTLASLDHRDMFVDPRLERVIAQSLANSQDVRLALANIAAARGLYRVQRSAQLPTVTGGGDVAVRYSPNGSSSGSSLGSSSGGGGGTGTTSSASSGKDLTTNYSVDIGASAFEIDLFGRVRSLSNAALDTYFATEAAARATKLTLVADVADAWFTLATDRSLLAIAQDTVVSARKSEALTKLRLDGGIAPRTDLRQAQTVRATAESDLANLGAIVQQDRNALDLLAGSTVADADLPPSIEAVETSARAASPGLDSSILLRRPDVIGCGRPMPRSVRRARRFSRVFR